MAITVLLKIILLVYVLRRRVVDRNLVFFLQVKFLCGEFKVERTSLASQITRRSLQCVIYFICSK